MGRSAEKTLPIIDEIKKTTGNDKVEFLQADLLDLPSVEAAADAFLKRNLPLHILVNNAGIMYSPWALSKQGIESQFATNHFAHVVLTAKLLPAIKRAPVARIVNLSSLAHIRPGKEGIHYDDLNNEEIYDKRLRYGESKLANIHFTRELQNRLEQAGINHVYVNAVHPGVVLTELGRHMEAMKSGKPIPWHFKMILIDSYKGAITQLFVAADPDIETKNYRGKYFVPYAALAEPNENGKSDEQALKTWKWTEEVLKKHFRSNWSWKEAGL